MACGACAVFPQVAEATPCGVADADAQRNFLGGASGGVEVATEVEGLCVLGDGGAVAEGGSGVAVVGE